MYLVIALAYVPRIWFHRKHVGVPAKTACLKQTQHEGTDSHHGSNLGVLPVFLCAPPLKTAWSWHSDVDSVDMYPTTWVSVYPLVLAFICHIGINLEPPGKREPHLKKCLHQIFSVADWCLLRVVPSVGRWAWLLKKGRWASLRKQACVYSFSQDRFKLHAPTLVSLSDGLWPVHVRQSQVNPSFSSWFWLECFDTAKESKLEQLCFF